MSESNYDLRKLQLVQVDMLKDLKTICEKHNIRFYLDSGTALGAVRHNGFIPWDNDIDVSMPYEDYERFLNLPQEEIGEKYFIQTYKSDENYYRAYARMRLNNTTMMYANNTKYKTHHGIWIDIFPIVELNLGFEAKFKKLLIKIANTSRMQSLFEATKESIAKEKSKLSLKLTELYYKLIPRKRREKLYDRILSYICKAKNKNSVTSLWCSITSTIPKSCYEGEPAKVLFEGEYYPLPAKYHEYLTIKYGDYMKLPPENERVCHANLIVDFDNDYTKYMEV